MDKRTLLFVVAVSLSIFAVNLFFSYQNQDQTKEWAEQQKVKKAEQQKKLTAEISNKIAPEEQLPLVAIYSDSEGQHPLTIGVQAGEGVLAIAWSHETPKTIFTKKLNSEEKLEELHEVTPPSKEGEPTFYSKDPNAKLSIANLPGFGKFELQLVSPNLENPNHPVKQSLGDFIDGHFSLPADKLTPPEPQSEAIALLKSKDGYLPVGIYDPIKKTLVDLDEYSNLSNHLAAEKPTATIATGKLSEEKYYVIENEYQQLVFSNYGGALIEINLPFKTEQNPKSVVREIQFDREMVEDHPYNAHFPMHSYYTPGTTKGKFEEHAEGKLGGYYPLLRRDLIEAKGRKSIKIPPAYYSLNIVSEYPEVAELIYEVKSFDKNSIVFESSQPHRRITKTYTVDSNETGAPYTFHLTINVEGDARGLWITSGVPEVEWISGSLAPALKYRITRGNKEEINNLDLPKDASTVSTVSPNWVCDSNGFFGLIIEPLTEIDSGFKAYRVPGTIVPSRLVEIDEEYDRFKADDLPGYAIMLPLKSGNTTMKFRSYAGPFGESSLMAVDKAFTNAEGKNPDFMACQSFHGWFAFISEPFAKFLFILMKFFYFITGSWGFSIILLTVALRVMLYPLNAWSTKSMVRMQQIAPEVTSIQERNKKDPKKAQVEIMNLYKERGVNPISGCFPLLIQMPFLIGMFDLLKSTFELRGASFVPGWIDDLTAPDVVFRWNYPVYFIGNEFHLLPILLGIVMFFQQRLMSTAPTDVNMMTDQQRQQRVMGNVMTFVFMFMFYNFPSGLNIYWLSSMILGILQQWWTTRQMKAKFATPTLVVTGKKKK